MQSNWQNFKILIPYIKPHILKIIIVLLIVPVGSLTFSIQPILIQKALDGPLLAGDLEGLKNLSTVFAIAVIANFFSQIIQFWLMSEIGQNVVADARYDLFKHIESLSMSFFDRTPVGRSVSRITSDMEQLAESFSGGLILIILDAFNILGILIFMFYLNLKLAFILLFFLIPVYWLNVHYQKIFRESNLVARKELSKLNSFLQQNIVGISVVHALNSIEKSMKKFAEYNKAFFRANDENIKADSQLSAYTELVSFIAIAALILIGTIISKSPTNTLSIGILVAFIQYAQSLFEPIRNLSDRFTIVQSAFTALERINEIKSEEEEIKDPTNSMDCDVVSFAKATSTPRNDAIIEFRNIWFKYQSLDEKQETNENWILKDFNCKIYPGEKVAFVGRSGSGKSTIIKLLTRLYDPQRGEVLINGINTKNIKQEDLRKYIGVIHQDSYIFAGNLIENIKLNRNEASLDMHLIEPIIDTTNLDLDHPLSERATNISSGEQQVINFARVLVGKPEIVVLDEATAKIDRLTELKLHEILDLFLKDKTAIFIAHRLETIKNCDKVIDLSITKI